MKQQSLMRESLLQFLFHLELPINTSQKENLILNEENLLLTHWQQFKTGLIEPLSSKQEESFLRKVVAILQYHHELEAIIQQYSKNWKNERISRVNYTVLLMAIYELTYEPQTPPKVVINEAIELTKKFGDKNSKDFINGLLDQYFKKEIKK